MTASSSAVWSRFSPPSNLMGMCRQCGSWSVAGHNHRKVIGRDPICASQYYMGLESWPVRKRFIKDHVWRGISKLAVCDKRTQTGMSCYHSPLMLAGQSLSSKHLDLHICSPVGILATVRGCNILGLICWYLDVDMLMTGKNVSEVTLLCVVWGVTLGLVQSTLLPDVTAVIIGVSCASLKSLYLSQKLECALYTWTDQPASFPEVTNETGVQCEGQLIARLRSLCCSVKVCMHIVHVNFNFPFVFGPKVGLRIIRECVLIDLPSVLWSCWLGGRKGIRPVKKLSGGVLAWLSVWSKVQICIWPSWCHSLSLASVKSR